MDEGTTDFTQKIQKILAELAQKAPFCGQARIVSENTIQAAKEEKQLTVLPAVKPMNHKNGQHGKLSPRIQQ